MHSLIKESELLSDAGADDDNPGLSVVKARPATVNELCLYHDRAYIEFVLSCSGRPLDNRSSAFGIEDVR